MESLKIDYMPYTYIHPNIFGKPPKKPINCI